MKLAWDNATERLYETGVDRGVLYMPNVSGVYDDGVAWNGLTGVTESPSGAEATALYADNGKYLEMRSAEEFGGTIEAYMCPPEFYQFDGVSSPSDGVMVGQQGRRAFGFGYRSRIGNDALLEDYGYKLHLVYGATVSPSERAYATINDSPEAITFSWEFTTTPVSAGDDLKATALITIDSTKVDATALGLLEDALYGTAGSDPRLPTPVEVLAFFSGTVTLVTPTEPTAVGNNVTIPSVTGVEYRIDGAVVTGVVTITEDVIVTAAPTAGYRFPEVVDDEWMFTHS